MCHSVIFFFLEHDRGGRGASPASPRALEVYCCADASSCDIEQALEGSREVDNGFTVRVDVVDEDVPSGVYLPAVPGDSHGVGDLPFASTFDSPKTRAVEDDVVEGVRHTVPRWEVGVCPVEPSRLGV